MSDDKRKVSTDALETLGTIIGPEEKRDAIHLAVIPVVSQENLRPGDHVTKDGKKSSIKCLVSCKEKAIGDEGSVGIVDPFLENDVKVGERFWLILYPRQIHSLRHVWTHPAFPDNEESIGLTDINIEKSKEWLGNFAKTIKEIVWDEEEEYSEEVPLNYDSLMEKTKRWIDEGKPINTWDSDNQSIPEFWYHYEIVTGTKVEEDKKYSLFDYCFYSLFECCC